MTEPRVNGALESGLAVLEALAQNGSGVGVSDLATKLSMDKGNVHRLLKTLINRGYVEQDATTKRYRVSAKLVGTVGSVLRSLDVRAAAETVCDDLVELTGESVHASQMSSEGPVYVLQRKAPFRVSVATEVGVRPPMHATATGKSILAFVPEADRAKWLVTPLEQFTFRTITTIEELERELATTASRGYAVDDEELTSGVRCVSAPIFAMDGLVVGCIGVSGPVQRMDIDRVPVIADLVIGAARQATERLGGPLGLYPSTSSQAAASMG